MNIHHFILTRFNLLLWNKDKEGHKVRSIAWLEHRFALFERYCLPSIKQQTCQNFEWIVLFDSTTPEMFKKRIVEYQRECKQLIPVFVEPERGRRFAEIFRQEVEKRIIAVQEYKGLRVLTTYLDNDDALNVGFVEDIQQRVVMLSDGTFIYYDNGCQLFTDYNYVMRVLHPRNHFVSVIECGKPTTLKTIYGFGSHYFIDKIKGVKIEHVKNLPMWCEVIHEKNMDNDAYFLRAKMMREAKGFCFTFPGSRFNYGAGVYLFRFLPRYARTYVRRVKCFFVGRHW